MIKHILFILFLLPVTVPGYGQSVYINEFMASNNHSIADGTGAHEDWFELYNPNSFTVDVGGYYLTDNLSTPAKYRLPVGSAQTIIPANGHLLLWASGEPARGALHVSFKLSVDGEQLGLYRADGVTVVDSLTFPAQRTDASRGRQPDGAATWLYFPLVQVSPGASNNGQTGYPQLLTSPVFSQKGGFYPAEFTLSVTSTDPAATIYYTVDGSDPDPGNPNAVAFPYKNYYPLESGQPYGDLLYGSYQTSVYSAAIAISDRSSNPNSVSAKATTFYNGPGSPATYIPANPVYKGTVVRALAYKANALTSDIVTQTYFISPSTARYSVPVVSIALTEKHLFDYTTGIYTAGAVYDTARANPDLGINDCTPGNYSNEGDNWQRPGNVEFFVNNTPVINQPIGLRTHGNCSRGFPRKSLRLYGDNDFQYSLFPTRPASVFYNRLILRSGGNDWNYSLIIDAYMQTLIRHLHVDTQANRPGVLFVNGEYWGVHNLYERYDKYYLNRNYAVATDSVDLVDIRFGFSSDAGDLVAYNTLAAYFNQTTALDYTYAKTQIDVESLADYEIAEVFSTNTDWPANNQQLWRKRTSQYVPDAPRGHDGRWRWMVKDVDYGLSFKNRYTLPALDNATGDTPYTLFFRRLLEVPDFKTYFINRYADLLNTTFLPGRTVDVLNTFKQDYQPYMPEHFARWAGGTTYEGWLANLDTISTFMQQRPAFARNDLRAKFGLMANQTLTVDVSNPVQGYVKVNTIDLLPTTVGVAAVPYPWTGIYFQGNQIALTARAKAGYAFKHWKEGDTIISTDTVYRYNPTTNRNLLAVFGPDESYNYKPRPFALLNCNYTFDSWAATAPAATYPANMHFVLMNLSDPALTATIADTVQGLYNYSSSTRINGLGAGGISFINTGGTNPGYLSGALGGALLALRTTEVTQATVKWRGGTVTANSRQYRIRLRYRVGNSGAFQDLLDSANNPVEYVRNAAGHSQVFGPVALPAALLDKPYIQLLWQYYWSGVGTSGARDQLLLDDIVIGRGACESVVSGSWNDVTTWSCGRIPTVCDDVVIKNGHVISLPIPNASARSMRFEANTRLLFTTPSATLFMQK